MQTSGRFIRVFIGLLLLASLLQNSLHGQSATIVFPSGTTTNFVLNISANQALRLYCNLPNWGGYLTKDATTISFFPYIYADRNILTVQGPLTFEWKATNTTSTGTLTYQILPSEGLVTKTYLASAGLDILVPAGKTLRIIDSSSAPILSYVLKNTEGVTSPQGNLSTEFGAHLPFFVTGPVTFSVTSSGDSTRYLTYYFTEDVIQLPAGAIQVSSQSNITIEKSTDLSNWSTVGVVPAPKDAKAFYRLKAAQ
ncbi:MAG TPA: hypothetical protein VGH19_18150 [Verrucomicrobiae bacterium]